MEPAPDTDLLSHVLQNKGGAQDKLVRSLPWIFACLPLIN